MLEKNGKKVVIIYDMPDLLVDLKECGFERPLFSNKEKCNLSQISMVNDFAEYDKILTTVQKNTHVQIFDTRPYIADNFPIDKAGNFNYRDLTHLSYRGSLFFADKYHFE